MGVIVVDDENAPTPENIPTPSEELDQFLLDWTMVSSVIGRNPERTYKDPS